MNKLLSLLAISLMLLGIPNAHARNSAATYDNKYWSQDEFVAAYNAYNQTSTSTGTIYRDFVVGLYVSADSADVALPTINPNSNLGQYVTEYTGSTTDNVYVFGVADENIPAGQLGRICIRGPHKVVYGTGSYSGSHAAPSLGTILSQCANNSTWTNTSGLSGTNGGVACSYTTATGTAGGMLGYVINATATTDTGDVGQSTNIGGNSTQSEYWAWIDPQVLR